MPRTSLCRLWRACFALFIVPASVGCAHVAARPEAAVYAAILNSADETYRGGAPDTQVVTERLEHRRPLRSAWPFLLSAFPAADTVALSRMGSVEGARFPPRIAGAPPYTLVPDSVMRTIFTGSGDSWQRFYAAFPNSKGVLTLSTVAFGADKKNAVVYLAHACGYLCARNEVVFLSVRNGRWVVVKRVTTLVS